MPEILIVSSFKMRPATSKNKVEHKNEEYPEKSAAKASKTGSGKPPLLPIPRKRVLKNADLKIMNPTSSSKDTTPHGSSKIKWPVYNAGSSA